MRWSRLKQQVWWITRDLLMLALGLSLVGYIVGGVVRMIQKGGRLSIGGTVVVVAVSALALAIVLPAIVIVGVVIKDIARVLLGKETEMQTRLYPP